MGGEGMGLPDFRGGKGCPQFLHSHKKEDDAARETVKRKKWEKRTVGAPAGLGGEGIRLICGKKRTVVNGIQKANSRNGKGREDKPTFGEREETSSLSNLREKSLLSSLWSQLR